MKKETTKLQKITKLPKKANPNKLAKKAKEILDKVEEEIKKPYTIETTFSLGGSTPLALKNDLCWQLRLNIKTILDRSFHRYNMKMILNQEPYEERIADIERDIRALDDEDTIPNMKDTEQLNSLNRRKEKVQGELKKMVEDTDEINLTATVITLKYSGNATVVDFDIPADQIDLLNKNRFAFSYYKLELEPLIDRVLKTNE
jgi:hypothetical protein